MSESPANEFIKAAEPSAQPVHSEWQLDVPEDQPRASRISEAAASIPPPLIRILEALIFVGGPPLAFEQAAAVIRGLTPAQFAESLDTLNRDYLRQGRPYHIQPQGAGHVLTLRPRFRSVVEQLYGQVREARLSSAAIDTLSLVAYRQPITKPEVDGLRGADSGGLLRQLVRRGLIAVVQRGESASRDVAYGTTTRFLELFKLTSLDDLPQTEDLQRL
jgi:segregation and condensation protein B